MSSSWPVIVSSPYWSLSGVNVFSANLVRGLRPPDWRPTLLLTEQRTELVRWSEPAMPLPDDVPIDYLPVHAAAPWHERWGAMIRYLEDRAPCIYIPNHDWRHSCVSPKLSPRVAIVGMVRSDDPLHYDHCRRLGKYWNAVVCVSRSIAARVVAESPELAPRVVTVHNGAPVAPSLPERAGDGVLRVIYAGRLAQHQKRILDLPRIAQALAARRIPFEVTVVGDGPEAQALRTAGADLIERGLLKLVGVVPHGEVLELFARHDVLLLTSEFEGMSEALIEAMGRGCVPVVSDIESGNADLVRHGVSGFRAPVGDVARFAEALETLQRDADLRQRLSRAAYESIASGGFRVEDMVGEYDTLLQRVRREAEHFARPHGRLRPPPPVVAGVDILPGDYENEARRAERSLGWTARLPLWAQRLVH